MVWRTGTSYGGVDRGNPGQGQTWGTGQGGGVGKRMTADNPYWQDLLRKRQGGTTSPQTPQQVEDHLAKTRENIQTQWGGLGNMFQTQPYAQLTGQMQQRASGANAPYSQQTQASMVGAQTDAINRQLQQQNLGANRAMDQSGVGGGLRAVGEAERGSAAGADTRRARMDITSKAALSNFNQQSQGQRDLADWLRQEMALKQSSVAGSTAALSQEEAFMRGGAGGPGGDPWKVGPGTPSKTPQQMGLVFKPKGAEPMPGDPRLGPHGMPSIPRPKGDDARRFADAPWLKYGMSRDDYIRWLKKKGYSTGDVPEGDED